MVSTARLTKRGLPSFWEGRTHRSGSAAPVLSTQPGMLPCPRFPLLLWLYQSLSLATLHERETSARVCDRGLGFLPAALVSQQW